MRAHPESSSSRATAEAAAWELLNNGQAAGDLDTRYRALVLLAAFASLRWGEVTALRRCDLDIGRAPSGSAPPSPSGQRAR